MRVGIPVYFKDLSAFITGQCKKILSKAIKNEMKCFDFGSIKRTLRPHLRQLQLDKFQYIDLLPLWEDMTVLLKSSYAKGELSQIRLNSVSTKSNLHICILIFHEPAQALKRF